MSEPTISANIDESLYHKLFEFAGDSIIVCSEHGFAIECNQATLNLFACTREKLIGTSPIDWSPEFQPDGRRSGEMAAEIFSRVKADGMARFEWENCRADRLPFPVDVDVRHAQVDGRDLFVIISRDITDRKRAEKTQHEAYESLRSILETTLDGFWRVDSQGHLLEVNPAYCRQSGYTQEELLRMCITDLEDRGSIAETAERNRRVIDNGHDQFESRHRRKDGSIWDVEVSVSYNKHAGGQFYLFLRDITGRKHIQESLRESEAKMKDVFENVPVGIFISTRKDGKFKYVNPVLPMIFGYSSAEELVTLTNSTSFAESFWVDPDQRRLMIERYDRDQQQWGFGETRCRRKDGVIIDITIVFNGRTDPTTKENLFYGIVTDVSERKRIEADLIAAKHIAETASLAKSRFLAAASHDLRQPMQAISLFAEALIKTDLNAEQRLISAYLAESTQLLGDLLNVLLDISRIDTGAVKPNPEAIPVDTLVRKVEAGFSALAAGKSLRFKLCFPFGDMTIVTDAKLLMSLLGNLIGNAVKYTGQGGILVAIRRRGSQALIQVWDTGIGIAPEHLDHIFEEYFQVENPERDHAKGLGLGLAIARRIARLLETEVHCRSRQGKGSVFEFCLPLTAAAERAPSSKIDPPETAAVTPDARHIVLVEDDPMVGAATQLALESCGMNVTRYKTAEEALADTDIAAADFYITDLRLPGLDGVEFLDAVQQLAAKPVKAVVVTGDTAVNQIEMMRSTSRPVLLKPVDLASLLAAIAAQDSVH